MKFVHLPIIVFWIIFALAFVGGWFAHEYMPKLKQYRADRREAQAAAQLEALQEQIEQVVAEAVNKLRRVTN